MLTILFFIFLALAKSTETVLYNNNFADDSFSNGEFTIDLNFNTEFATNDTSYAQRGYAALNTVQARDFPPQSYNSYIMNWPAPSYNIRDQTSPASPERAYFEVDPGQKLITEFQISFDAIIAQEELDYYGVAHDDYRMGFMFFHAFNYETGMSIDFALSKYHILAFQGSSGGAGIPDSNGDYKFTQPYSSAIKVADAVPGHKYNFKTIINRVNNTLEWYLGGELVQSANMADLPVFPVYAQYDFFSFIPPESIVPFDLTKLHKWYIGPDPKFEYVHCGPLGNPDGPGLLDTTSPGVMGYAKTNFARSTWGEGDLVFGSTSTSKIYKLKITLED